MKAVVLDWRAIKKDKDPQKTLEGDKHVENVTLAKWYQFSEVILIQDWSKCVSDSTAAQGCLQWRPAITESSLGHTHTQILILVFHLLCISSYIDCSLTAKWAAD